MKYTIGQKKKVMEGHRLTTAEIWVSCSQSIYHGHMIGRNSNTCSNFTGHTLLQILCWPTCPGDYITKQTAYHEQYVAALKKKIRGHHKKKDHYSEFIIAGEFERHSTLAFALNVIIPERSFQH